MKVIPEVIIKQHRTVKGMYKASVIGADGREVSSTDWRPNLILNSGLDKLAHMPWSQVFQVCVAGTQVAPSAPDVGEVGLQKPWALNGFYYSATGYCGHSTSGDTVTLFRTFDFKEDGNLIYTELGFKETPGAAHLFSRVVLDPPQKVHAGQFLRVSYQLFITMSPSSTSVVSAPEIVGWTTGTSDTHRIQMYGMAGVDSATGLTIPIDANAGYCNEIFAPGTRNFGPGFGYVPRYQNGSAVTYVGDTVSDPRTLVGPLKAYAGVYQDPFSYVNKLLRDANATPAKGALYLSGVHLNYWTRAFVTAMASYHGYTVAFSDDSAAGRVTAITPSAPGKEAPVSVAALTHLMQSAQKYNPYGSLQQAHACGTAYFDPALGDPAYSDQSVYGMKSCSPFSLGEDGTIALVRQPSSDMPYWESYEVAGSSCFLSTSATALAEVGACVDRATAATQCEVPLRLDPYKNGSVQEGAYLMDSSTSPTGSTSGARKRTKYAVFDSLVANNAGWKTLGIGGTSNTLTPASMTNAAKYNGYSYVFNTANAKANTHYLAVAFVYTWDRA